MTSCYIYVMAGMDTNMGSEARIRVNENGRVVIPASFRKALGIRAGDEVVLQMKDDELRISTVKSRIERAQRRVARYTRSGESLADELIAERREAATRE
jgi:AbrB family looped-hinge helix DNA binding protein